MKQTKSLSQTNKWGEFNIFSLTNKNSIQVDISDLGASIINFFVNDRDNKKTNIVLGYNTPEEYIDGNVYFGCVIGPWANRIAQGQFTLDDRSIQLEQNEGSNHLHGGSAGIDSKRWTVNSVSERDISLSVELNAGEAGYPADIKFMVKYTLNDNNELVIDYSAIPAGRTPINMTQHTYFNLSGGRDNILDHTIQINAESFLEVDEKVIPVMVKSVVNTPMDLRQPTLIAQDIDSQYQQLVYAGGFDHCWCLDGEGIREAAVVSDDKTGISLTISTDQIGIQFYSGNFLDSEQGRDGNIYSKRHGLCLETQCYPDQVNMSNAESCIYSAGDYYTHTSVFKISVS